MNNKYAKSLAGLMLAGALALPASAANVLTNASFETGDYTGWTTNGQWINNDAHTGQFASYGMGGDFLKQVFPAVAVSGMGGDFLKQVFPAVAVSQITDFSFWAKRDGGLFDSISFYYSDNTSGSYLLNTLGGSSDWTHVSLLGQLNASKSLTGFLIYGTSPGPANFDDFNLAAPVPEPETYALMLGGLGLMGFLRRRQQKMAK